MKRLYLIILSCWAMLSVATAQDMTVNSVIEATDDTSASDYPQADVNGDPTALVKVTMPVNNATFEGSVIGNVEYKNGQYWVYLCDGSYMLKVKHPDYHQLFINLRDYGIRRVKASKTYVIGIDCPTSNKSQAKITWTGDDRLTIQLNGVAFNMVSVKGGTFQMGSVTKKEAEWCTFFTEKVVHQVTLSDYLIGETEVTQALWKAVMKNNPAYNKGDELPMENISWEHCQLFINKLNQLTGLQFRLPTEAEWEYAARGGQKGQGLYYSGSKKLKEVGWYNKNSENRTHPVRQLAPNELGLYDMTGNVSELCQDWKGDYTAEAQTNPKGPATGTSKILRGGAYNSSEHSCYIADRFIGMTLTEREKYAGFRLALTYDKH